MFSLVPWRKERARNGNVVPRNASPFALLHQEFDSLFDRVFGNWLSPFQDDWSTPGWGLYMKDTGTDYVVKAEAPGFEPGEFDVHVTGNQLHIRAEHKEEANEGEEPGYRESRQARFERWLTLPAGTDAEKVEARYRNGVLEVRLPKTAEALGRRIEVKT
jgi:HSP20 family protein